MQGAWTRSEITTEDREEAEAFWEDLAGPGVGDAESVEAQRTPPQWLPIARRIPLTFSSGSMTMPILGVVVHTTNHGAGAETLDRFAADWNAMRKQSTQFMVDREGNIGQFRSTRDRGAHIKPLTKREPRWDHRYFGIEHIAKHNQALTDVQIERSARLIGDLASMFGFPARALSARGGQGIGIHIDFKSSRYTPAGTGCGQSVFWTNARKPQRTAVFERLVHRAHDFATWGF